ncbi:MAG: ABC transporter substrate-binding protein [Alphaproteobacteria bacterium]
MDRLRISLACQNSDRTRALIDGRVAIEGVDANWVPVDPEEIFHRAFRHQEFDVCEISLATHLTLTARDGSPFVGVPAFLSRAFRHSAIYVRAGGEVKEAAALAGRRVGVPDYQQTAALWVRGMLLDDHGVHPRDVTWLAGGLEERGREMRTKISLPPEISVAAIPPDRTLSAMLAAGEIDAIVSPRAPSCFTDGSGRAVRLFPDHRAAEEAYFRKHGHFPLMHAVGIRRDLHARHPWLAASLMKAFVEAKEIAFADMRQTNYMRASLPWLAADVARVQAVLGADYWRYGVAESRGELEAMARYALTDGLAPRLVAPEELFAASTIGMFRR